MSGIWDSLGGVIGVGIAIVIIIILLHRDDKARCKREDQRHNELIRAILNINKQDRGEQNGESKPTETDK